MTASNVPITLREYVTQFLPQIALTYEQGELLWRRFDQELIVSAPSFKNGNQWELTSQGWVGYIPLSAELNFYLEPKVPLRNLFGMWDYAYQLRSYRILPEIMQCSTLQEFYQQLASVLAKHTIARGRKGYYRAYIGRSEGLAYIRGRLDLGHMLTKPWDSSPHCHFHEHTADVAENQLLAWTLYAILRSGYCNEVVLPTLRAGYRSVTQAASLQPFLPDDCVGRAYNRLNQDYQPLHALCRFFLANTGPSYQIGDRAMLPFLFDMAALYELFVAEWLRAHLPDGYEVRTQVPIYYGELDQINSKIDLVIYRSDTRQPVCVLDTKYKNPEIPSAADIHQIHYYATVLGCAEGILIYPMPLPHPVDTANEHIRIRSVVFALGGDLEQAGEQFLRQLNLPVLAVIDSPYASQTAAFSA